MQIITIVLVLAVIVLLPLVISLYATNSVLENDFEKSKNEVSELKEYNKEITKESDLLIKRVLELEDSIENEYGVKVRIENKYIDFEFDNRELWYISDSVRKNIKSNGNVDELKELIDLYEKATDMYRKYEEVTND
jgi:hypothetical protein